MNTAVELDVFSCELDGINQIEASAGTGKTWNICGLYLRLLLQRALPVQQILVVTFTNAATAELRERIRARIIDTQRYLQSDGAHAADPFVATLIATTLKDGGDRIVMLQRLDLALQTFDEAAIYTIHGFCQRALADSPFAVGMPFATELVADDREFVLRAVQDFWRQRISSGAVGTELIEFLASQKDDPQVFAALLQRQLKKSQSRILWPDQIDAPFSSSRTALQSAFVDAKLLWQAHAAQIESLLLASADALHQASYKPDLIHTACLQWHEYFDVDEDDETAACRFDTTPNKRFLLSTQSLQDKTKKNKQTPTHAFFDAADTLLTLQTKAAADLALARLRLLRDMLHDCTAALYQAKRDQRVQSYDDILLNVFNALANDATQSLAARLRQTYPAALIDEFQDTDPLQFAIFSAIYRNRLQPLFFVGDPKQAIYSFRNADLYTYLRARLSATAHYRLADNQRSSAALIDAQNALFGANANAFILPDLTYQPVQFGKKPRTPLIDHSQPESALQVWTLHDDDAAQSPSQLPDYATARRLAVQATAAEIARLLNAADHGQITLGDRALRAGDIAVLVKSHAQGNMIRQALAALRVGCVELSQASIFDSVDAAELEQVLQAINEPTRVGLLLAALATELLGFDAVGIDAIANDDAALQVHTDTLMQYRRLWRERGVGFMFRRLLSEQNVSVRMLQRPDGERRMTNLLHLGETLFQAATLHPAPDALLRWLGEQRRATSINGRIDDAAQLRLESDQNLVQIVTIHRAKGLEYPIVFCPFLWQGRLVAGADSVEGYEYHDDDQHIVIDLRPEPPDIDGIKQKIKEDQAAEFIRLMYVALTRAAHRCYLIAGAYTTKAFGNVSHSESSRSLLNWLVAGNGSSFSDWNTSKLTPAEIAAAWRDLAAQHPSAIGLSTIPTGTGVAITALRTQAEALGAQAAPQSIRPVWRMTSFSALLHATQRPHIGRDRDVRSSMALAVRPPPTASALDDIVRFPRGPGAGDTLHAILEKIDFSDPTDWSRVIRNGLQSYPQTLADTPAAQQLPRQEKMVRQMLQHLVQTPLTPHVKLADVPRTRCLPELGFNLPASEIDAQRINKLLQQAGYAMSPLDFKRMSGYLKGYIDLVFETHGSFYVLDWKSNYLGAQANDYARPQIEQAMAEHGYHLQSLLYAVALHRYLQRRVPGYDYATHFGGVLYLFIRGVRPHWVTDDGAQSGVYFHKPAWATIKQLDRLFSARTDEGAA